jgi:hypothetical protein
MGESLRIKKIIIDFLKESCYDKGSLKVKKAQFSKSPGSCGPWGFYFRLTVLVITV